MVEPDLTQTVESAKLADLVVLVVAVISLPAFLPTVSLAAAALVASRVPVVHSVQVTVPSTVSLGMTTVTVLQRSHLESVGEPVSDWKVAHGVAPATTVPVYTVLMARMATKTNRVVFILKLQFESEDTDILNCLKGFAEVAIAFFTSIILSFYAAIHKRITAACSFCLIRFRKCEN